MNPNKSEGVKSVVHLGDCLAAMREMPDKCFDLAIVDPPYGIGAGNMKFGDGKLLANGQPCNKSYRGGKDWDSAAPPPAYFKELFRVSKNQIIFGGNYFIEHLHSSRCFIFWDKGNTIKGRDFADGEWAWTSFDRNAREYEIMPKQDDRMHPCQKPVKLYRRIIEDFSKPDDTILDTHLGSGSIRIAAHQMGRSFVGYELDETYYKDQEKRFALAIQQQSLFL